MVGQRTCGWSSSSLPLFFSSFLPLFSSTETLKAICGSHNNHKYTIQWKRISTTSKAQTLCKSKKHTVDKAKKNLNPERIRDRAYPRGPVQLTGASGKFLFKKSSIFLEKFNFQLEKSYRSDFRANCILGPRRWIFNFLPRLSGRKKPFAIASGNWF